MLLFQTLRWKLSTEDKNSAETWQISSQNKISIDLIKLRVFGDLIFFNITCSDIWCGDRFLPVNEISKANVYHLFGLL